MIIWLYEQTGRSLAIKKKTKNKRKLQPGQKYKDFIKLSYMIILSNSMTNQNETPKWNHRNREYTDRVYTKGNTDIMLWVKVLLLCIFYQRLKSMSDHIMLLIYVDLKYI